MLKFVVRGSTGSEYEVIALRDGDRFRMSCTCEAGQRGTFCKHRFALLGGEISSLLSGNDTDVLQLKKLICGTAAERHYGSVCALEREKILLESRLKMERKALGREAAG